MEGAGEEMVGSGAGAVKDVRRGGNGLRVVVLLAALVGGLGSVATAQSEGEDEKLNELALVLAATYEDEEASFTLGIEYERDLGEFLAVMGVVEYVPDSESRELVFVVPFVLKPAGGLKLLAGPGFARKEESRFLFRLGAAWSFDLGERWAITPGVELDLVDGDDGLTKALVFGGSVGYRF